MISWPPLADEAEGACERWELNLSLEKLRRVRERCRQSRPELSAIQAELNELGERVKDELKARMFMSVPPHRAEYWNDTPLFSKNVQQCFRTALDDMGEAGKCLAAGRYKACAYHLMLVGEVGVKRVARILKVPVSHKDTWGGILTKVNPAVAGMPTGTPKEANRKAAFSRVAGQLGYIKEGWRNKTMHPGLAYGDEQGILMFKNVCALMDLLAELR